MNLNKTKIHKSLNLIINILLLLAAYFFIYYQLVYNNDIIIEYTRLKHNITNTNNYILIIITIILMPLNWMIEAYKWRYLIRKTEIITFVAAFKGVLTGITTSIFTPNRIGDFIGKAFMLKKSNHWKAILISLLGSMSQLLITFIIGSVSFLMILFIYFKNSEFFTFYFAILFISIVLLLVFFLFYFNVPLVTKKFLKVIPDKWIKIKNYLNVISHFTSNELTTVLFLSLSRYFVFNFQLFLLFRIFSIEVSLFESYIISGSIFFVLYFIPSITLAEIGIRGSVAIAVFSIYSEYMFFDASGFRLEAVAAINGLWIINIIIPAIIGSVFVMKLRFFNVLIAKREMYIIRE